MIKKPLLLAAVIGLLATGAFLLLNGSSADNAADNTFTNGLPLANDETTPSDTTNAIQAAQWGDNVSIALGEGEFTYESDGLPNHELPDQFVVPTSGPAQDGSEAEFVVLATSDWILESPIDQTITLSPVYSDTTTETQLGIIGVTISGAPIYNDYENTERTIVALDDNRSIGDALFIDTCNGHALREGDSYHYHGVPYCVTDTVDQSGEHSTIIGAMLDGFPLYGNKDEGGVAITNDGLDECSGHFGATPEFPGGIYHYHLTDDQAPYSIDCFHGEIDYNTGGGTGPGAGGPPPERR